ncbi:MAG TPA: 30S ribosomal protein S9, partial [Polyangiaceae bacterium]|nr:30S ribosomal protein S9 [Polyangiaceae bacterium]
MSEVSTYATGKRKTAVARVWISPGSGKMIVNGTEADHYFERETSRMIARQSLEVLELLDKYDVRATVAGGGHSAQA